MHWMQLSGFQLGNIHRDAALFIGGRALRSGAVHMRHKGGNRQLVALLGVDRVQDVVDIVLQILAVGGNQLLLVARRRRPSRTREPLPYERR